MPKSHTLILRMPFAKAVGAARSHMIANPPELGAINRVGSVMIGVDASDATHRMELPDPTQISFVRNIDGFWVGNSEF